MTIYQGIINGVVHMIEVDDNNHLERKFVEFDENDAEMIALVQKHDYKREIENLKAKLSMTDYIACKIAEGEATKEEYAFEIEERREYRARINELEALLNS